MMQKASLKTLILWFTPVLLLAGPFLKAQDNTNPTAIKSLTKIRLTLFGVGVEREQKIAPLKSVYVGASYSAIFPFESRYLRAGRAPDIPMLNNILAVTPVFYAGFRSYNFTKRKEKNKNTANNSADYVGFKVDGILPSKSPNGDYKTLFAMSVAAHWGMQRSLSKKLNFEFAFGPAIKTDFEATRFVPFSKLGLTFLL
ncbi:MAG: hypothetical protein EOO07_34600 [Chitinophagaceae bacterium]|nr:MAG: hypothetical protein EOO07_34600 [Chitinophagaceae bacterium]